MASVCIFTHAGLWWRCVLSVVDKYNSHIVHIHGQSCQGTEIVVRACIHCLHISHAATCNTRSYQVSGGAVLVTNTGKSFTTLTITKTTFSVFHCLATYPVYANHLFASSCRRSERESSNHTTDPWKTRAEIADWGKPATSTYLTQNNDVRKMAARSDLLAL